MNISRHRFLMLQILKDIYEDKLLAGNLGFKGGTALMFFYQLPRFSVDLDFNLINNEQIDNIYDNIRKILLKYGKIDDEAKKYFGMILVLDYGKDERKLKIEVSTRFFDDHYEVKNLMGISMRVMLLQDMFAYKLCALLDRKIFTNRDLYDTWFLLQKNSPINKNIIEQRMNQKFRDYIQNCIQTLEKMSDKGLFDGLTFRHIPLFVPDPYSKYKTP